MTKEEDFNLRKTTMAEFKKNAAAARTLNDDEFSKGSNAITFCGATLAKLGFTGIALVAQAPVKDENDELALGTTQMITGSNSIAFHLTNVSLELNKGIREDRSI